MPLAGVLLWGWSVGDVILLYWIENVIVGVMNVLRITTARPPGTTKARLIASKLGLVPFSSSTTGCSASCTGIFVASMFPGPDGRHVGLDARVTALLAHPWWFVSVVVIFMSHAISFARDDINRGEYRRVDLASLIHRPYGRIVVVHVFILGGGFAAEYWNSPLALLAAFVILKTTLELAVYQRERQALRRA